ncbi:hypothetical protein BH11PSE11_BH11PSE11_01740 [soil metagenome]
MIRLPFFNKTFTPSVRTSLVILIVGCILPIAIVAAYLIVDFYEGERTQLAKNAVSRVRAISSAVDRNFVTTQSALSTLGTSPSIVKGDLSAFHAQAVTAVANLHAESIVMLDTTGQLLLSTNRPFGVPLPRIPKPTLLKRILQTGKPGVSDLFMGPVVERLIYTIAVPIRRDGSIVYSLNATAQPTQLVRVLADQKLPDSWRGVITDSTGTIVARTHNMEKFFGKKVTPDLLQRMSGKAEDAFESTTLEGISVLTVYSRSPLTNWTTVIGMPMAEITAGLRRTLTFLIFATIAALGIGLMLARVVGGRIAQSISALTAPARALGFGDIVSIEPLHFKEANELRQAFIDAGTTLQKAQYEAHHDVLTGLANRVLFQIVVERQLSLSRRNKTELAILYIDLDGFKSVNDTFGHAIGDMLLREVAIRIKDAIRESDMATRLGGDEFAIVLIQVNSQYAKSFAEKLIDIISASYQLGEVQATISASIGIASYPESASDTDTLLQLADYAMYSAKESGKRRVCIAENRA